MRALPTLSLELAGVGLADNDSGSGVQALTVITNLSAARTINDDDEVPISYNITIFADTVQ